MKKAIQLAKKAQKQTYPNPCVGAVLVNNNKIVASGYHKKAGLAHAEIEAINDAVGKGIELTNCTLYVTLEPCNHQGKTPPCTKAIIDAGIKNVVIGTLDNNPDVAGGGAAFLRKNGVNVVVGKEHELCQELIEDFIVWKTFKRPFITLKMATTLDGKIATSTGDSSWISCEASRIDVHLLRKNSNAILVGQNTFFKDNPKLTARIKGVTKQALSVVATNKLPNINDDLYLIKERPKETIFFTSYEESISKKAKDLMNIGCEIKYFDNLNSGFNWLFENKNCYYLLCEGGGFLAHTLVRQNMIDEFIQYIAPISIGNENSKSLFSGGDVVLIKNADKWKIKEYALCGSDLKLKLKLFRG